MLWLWSAVNAPDGDLSGLDPEDIAEAAGWTKKAEVFVAALQTAGFLDGLQIHDWMEFAGKNIAKMEEKRRQNRERQRRYRENHAKEVSDKTEECCVSGANVMRYMTGDSVVSNAHNITEHNITEHNNSQCQCHTPLSFAGESDFDDFLRAADAIAPGGVAVWRPLLEAHHRTVGLEVCRKALQVTIDKGKSITYLIGILNKKAEQGVESLEDWERVESAGRGPREPSEWRAITGLEEAVEG